MKSIPITLTTGFACVLAGVVAADQFNVAIDGFGYPDPQSWTITEGDDLDFRVMRLTAAPGGVNASTHILIEGLSPLEADTSVYASPYSGVDVNSGATLDTGVLYLNMPAGGELPAGTVASPIVGVVQRPGDWDSYSPQFPSTSVGGATGTVSVVGNTMAISMSRGLETFSANTTFTVADSSMINVDAFTLSKDGVPTYSMSEALLTLSGDSYVGVLTNLTTTPIPTPPDMQFEYDSLIFSIELSGGDDTDGDGVPDLSDDNSSITLVAGAWNQTNLFDMYGISAEWGYSPWLGFTYVPYYPWVYQSNFGWLYAAGSAPVAGGAGFWLMHDSLGWIYAHSSGQGVFQAENSNWDPDNFITPNP